MAKTTEAARPAVLPLVLLGVLIACFVTGALTAVSVASGVNGARPLPALGLPDPGWATTYGLPLTRVVTEISAVLTVGALLLASVLAAPERSGYLGVSGYRALRWGSWCSAVWTAGALLMVPLTVADSLGRPLTEVLLRLDGVLAIASRLEVAIAWTVTALIAVLVLAGCRTALTWKTSVLLLAGALAGLLPVAATGHSAAGGAHDLATDSLMVHVLAAALWVGGLVGLLALASRPKEAAAHLPVATRRFATLALCCWSALALSGVVNALVRVSLADVFGTFYGALLLAKLTALALLGGLGYLQRRRAVDDAMAGRFRTLARLGAIEVFIMLGTLGLAVALSRSAPPPGSTPAPSRTEVLIGYDLSGPPTVARLLLEWRFNLVFGTAALAAATLYLVGVRKLLARGDHWPVGRTISWLVGCAVLLVATSSGIGRYAPAMFSLHMAQHMLLSMLVPILLVLGGPVGLALRTLPSGGRDGPPGPREWLLTLLHAKLARWLAHPFVVLPLFVGSYYALYFSGLFELALPSHPAHLWMLAHFLLTGFLFFWVVIGIDPAPSRLAPVARLALLFSSVPFHAFFGVAVMSSATVIGREYYTSLGLPWVTDLLAEQRLGGGIAWASGELPLLVVLIALMVQWSRVDERAARRADRKAALDGDAELAAYNAMLRQMAEGSSARARTADRVPEYPDGPRAPAGRTKRQLG